MPKDQTASDYAFTLRIRSTAEKDATAYARNHSFRIHRAASFRESDPHPSAIEYFLGAIGGDLITGFSTNAARHGITIDSLELSVSARLNNPLVFLGVVGEEGHPGFESIHATLYVNCETEESSLQAIWQETLNRSPLLHSLHQRISLSLQIQQIL